MEVLGLCFSRVGAGLQMCDLTETEAVEAALTQALLSIPNTLPEQLVFAKFNPTCVINLAAERQPLS